MGASRQYSFLYGRLGVGDPFTMVSERWTSWHSGVLFPCCSVCEIKASDWGSSYMLGIELLLTCVFPTKEWFYSECRLMGRILGKRDR